MTCQSICDFFFFLKWHGVELNYTFSGSMWPVEIRLVALRWKAHVEEANCSKIGWMVQLPNVLYSSTLWVRCVFQCLLSISPLLLCLPSPNRLLQKWENCLLRDFRNAKRKSWCPSVACNPYLQLGLSLHLYLADINQRNLHNVVADNSLMIIHFWFFIILIRDSCRLKCL